MEQVSKYWLQSKTVIGALLIALSMIAPVLGIDFKAEDANAILANLDAIVSAVGLILVVWGRATAQGPLTMKVNTPKLHSPWIVSVLAALVVLSGCAVQNTEDKSPTQIVRTTYDALRPSLDVYYALPACAPEVVGLCAKADVVAKLQEYDALFLGYLTTAEALVGADGATPEEIAAAEKAAQNALRTLVTIYAIQAITKA